MVDAPDRPPSSAGSVPAARTAHSSHARMLRWAGAGAAAWGTPAGTPGPGRAAAPAMPAAASSRDGHLPPRPPSDSQAAHAAVVGAGDAAPLAGRQAGVPAAQASRCRKLVPVGDRLAQRQQRCGCKERWLGRRRLAGKVLHMLLQIIWMPAGWELRASSGAPHPPHHRCPGLECPHPVIVLAVRLGLQPPPAALLAAGVASLLQAACCGGGQGEQGVGS